MGNSEDRLDVARDHVIEALNALHFAREIVDKVLGRGADYAAQMLILKQSLQIAEQHLKIIEAIVAEQHLAAIEERLAAIGSAIEHGET
jgi:nitrogen regulatory protein PII